MARTADLRMSIEKLPLEQREVIVLHYLEGYTAEEIAQVLDTPVTTVNYRLLEARTRLRREFGQGDLPYMNGSASAVLRRWEWLPLEALTVLEARLSLTAGGLSMPHTTKGEAKMSDETQTGISRRKLLGTSGSAAAAAAASGLSRAVDAAPQNEADIVDRRLSRKVTLAVKGIALSDLCDQLRKVNGMALVAGPSVADEKVTLFCKKLPLREVMRQLSRPFGYTWLRSGLPSPLGTGEPGCPPRRGGAIGRGADSGRVPTQWVDGASGAGGRGYRYELVQDLRSQLLEEELRNRDRNEALLALEQEIEKYRPYLDLSPDEVLERARTAPPAEKKVLESLGGGRPGLGLGWGITQMYFRLTPSQLAALRAGEELRFSQEPASGEEPLPPDVARGVLQSLRTWRLLKTTYGYAGCEAETPGSLPLSAVPEARALVNVKLSQTELGQFGLQGLVGYSAPGAYSRSDDGPYAVGVRPKTVHLDNALINAKLARDPALRAPVSVHAEPSCAAPLADKGEPSSQAAERREPKVTTADVLEALHGATGMPIIADFYTRLYDPSAVARRDLPLFDTLNQLCDTMRLRWNRTNSGSSSGA